MVGMNDEVARIPAARSSTASGEFIPIFESRSPIDATFDAFIVCLRRG